MPMIRPRTVKDVFVSAGIAGVLTAIASAGLIWALSQPDPVGLSIHGWIALLLGLGLSGALWWGLVALQWVKRAGADASKDDD